MRLRNHAFWLAITLAAAAPTFADGIASNGSNDSIVGDRGDSSRREARHANVMPAAFASHNFAVDAIKPGGARVDLDAAGSSRGSREGNGGSGFSGSENAEEQSSGHSVDASDVDSGHGDSSGSHDGNDGDKPHGKNHGDSDGGQAAVPVAEPGSGALSLFGFLMVGMMVYRRKSPTNGI